MTAGRSAGTEQGQGRECAGCGHTSRPHGAAGCYVHIGLFGGPVVCRCRVFTEKTTLTSTANPSPSVPPARDSGHKGDAASFRVTVRAGDPASADRLAHAAAEMVTAEFGADVQHQQDSGRDEAREAVALPRFSNLLVPVEGHVLACQGCGSLVLDNLNAVAIHARFHAAALLRDGTGT